MLLNEYELRKVKPVNMLERYSKLEGLDYGYLMAGLKSTEANANRFRSLRSLVRLLRLVFKREKGFANYFDAIK